MKRPFVLDVLGNGHLSENSGKLFLPIIYLCDKSTEKSEIGVSIRVLSRSSRVIS